MGTPNTATENEETIIVYGRGEDTGINALRDHFTTPGKKLWTGVGPDMNGVPTVIVIATGCTRDELKMAIMGHQLKFVA